MVINSSNIPNDLDENEISYDNLPNIYRYYKPSDGASDPGYYTSSVDTSHWTARKETRIRDKWMKVRVRYSGKNLAVIHSLITLYNVSYA